jgi:hypothetical protein
MFRYCLQFIYLSFIVPANDQVDLSGRWNWMRAVSAKMLLLIVACCISSAIAVWEEKPPVLFLNSRINYAWGYVHEGWLIDSSGAIRNYNFTEADSIGYVRQTDTLPSKIYNKLKLLAKSTPTGKNISPDTLLSKWKLIKSESSGILSYSRVCADAGMYRYSAFLYDAHDSPQPKEVICFQMGDEWICNSAAAAKKIARWLNSIDTMDLRFCNPPDSCINGTTSMAEKGSSTRKKPVPVVIDNKTITIGIAQSGTIVIRSYTLRGELLAKPFEQFLPAGEHRINLAHILSGIQSKKPMLLKISINGIGTETKTVIISQDK